MSGDAPHGMHGNYLRIELGGPSAAGAPAVSALTSTRVPLPEAVRRRTIGGIGLGAWLLLRESAGRYDALAPQAPLVLAFAPFTGSALNTSAKAAVLCKSPLTGRLNDAMISSHLALAGKGTGHDALVVRGACAQWSTLFVSPDGAELRPTPELCGLSAAAAEARIRKQWGGAWQVAAIGPAGENLVPFATLSHDGRHAGRGGTGAVLGAKRLKAIALRGGLSAAPAHPEALKRLQAELKQASLGPGTEKYRSTGTLGNLLVFDRIGILPTRNFSGTSNAQAHQLSAETLLEAGKVERATCADCMIGCEKRVADGKGGSTRLEYENVYALGALMDVWALDEVLEASRLCDHYGLDSISTGGTLAFAADCVAHGLLDAPQLRFGDAATLREVIPLIARREGIGALLALGSRAVAERLGPGAQQLTAHVKGLELPGYHPAGLQSLALGLAVGARGADHNKSGAYDLDLSGEVDRFALGPDRVQSMVALEDTAALLDSLILCKFVRRALHDPYAQGAEMLRALTGLDFSAEELRASAAGIHDLKKRFNQRQGWEASEDTLPPRFMATAASATARAQDAGAGADTAGAPADTGINPEHFAAARSRYYALRGWSPEGRLPPAAPGLAALGLPD